MSGLQPTQADRFVDSVGLNVHLASVPYSSSLEQVELAVVALHIRHLRDELRPDNDLAPWRRLFEKGVQGHLLVSPATNTASEMMAYIDALGVVRLSAIEGQNEGDSAWFKAQPSSRPSWAQAVVKYQREIFEAARARYSPGQLAVVSPTVLDYLPEDMRLLRASVPFCDYVGLHAYLQGQQEPETGADYAALGWYLREMRDGYKPGSPVMITETGYSCDLKGLPQHVRAKYLPRLLLNAFEAGVARTFLYELLDEGTDVADPEQNYGLISASGDPTPAYDAVQLLLGTLTDRGPDFEPEPLAVSVNSAPNDLRSATFQRRDGTVVMAFWRALPSWDGRLRREIAVAPVPLRLTFDRRFGAMSTLKLRSGAFWEAARHEIMVDDTVTLLRLAA